VAPDIGFVRNFEKILALYHDGSAHKLLVQASCALHQLLGDLYALVCHDASVPESSADRIERTLQAVRTNLGMNVSVQELAALANMSHTHYTLQFRRQVGENPRSYINKLKIQRASELLLASDLKVEAVAREVGFDDAFYFCRLFKRLTGRTPTDFRRQPAPATSVVQSA
jgi:AraC-like DNA-binding protein